MSSGGKARFGMMTFFAVIFAIAIVIAGSFSRRASRSSSPLRMLFNRTDRIETGLP
jgi:hypothetical protein